MLTKIKKIEKGDTPFSILILFYVKYIIPNVRSILRGRRGEGR